MSLFYDENDDFLVDQDQLLDDDLAKAAANGMTEHRQFLDIRDRSKRETDAASDKERADGDNLNREVQDKFFEEDDFEEKKQKPKKSEMETKAEALKVLKIVFICIYLVEAYLFYAWVISPLLPLISDIAGNAGLPTVDASGISAFDPFGITVSGMKAQDFGALILGEAVRTGILSVLFAVTRIAHRIIKKVILD